MPRGPSLARLLLGPPGVYPSPFDPDESWDGPTPVDDPLLAAQQIERISPLHNRFQINVPFAHDPIGNAWLAFDRRTRADRLLIEIPSAIAGTHLWFAIARAEALARLHAPQLIGLRQVLVYEGRLHVALERPSGVTLAVLLDLLGESRAPLPSACALVILEDVRRTLRHLHRRGDIWPLGVPHLRLSADCIWLEPDGAVRVSHFGLAALADELPSVAARRQDELDLHRLEQLVYSRFGFRPPPPGAFPLDLNERLEARELLSQFLQRAQLGDPFGAMGGGADLADENPFDTPTRRFMRPTS
jgi:serine/threonine protein kinase